MDTLFRLAAQLRQFIDYVTGRTDERPTFFKISSNSLILGVWWGILLIIILTFNGQSSKFIYIDF